MGLGTERIRLIMVLCPLTATTQLYFERFAPELMRHGVAVPALSPPQYSTQQVGSRSRNSSYGAVLGLAHGIVLHVLNAALRQCCHNQFAF